MDELTADEPTVLDGNAAAGPLRTLFAVDLTAAVGRCDGCGRSASLGQAPLHTRAPGLVLRCPGCDQVLLRLVTGPGRAWLDMRGLTSLQVEVAP